MKFDLSYITKIDSVWPTGVIANCPMAGVQTRYWQSEKFGNFATLFPIIEINWKKWVPSDNLHLKQNESMILMVLRHLGVT